MHFASHLLISWGIGELFFPEDSFRRKLITVAGISPDFDTVAYIAAFFWSGFDIDAGFEVHRQVHHHYTHGIFFALAVSIICMLVAAGKRKKSIIKTGFSCFVALIVHSVCDIVGSGPNWPIYPYWPLNDATMGVTWSWTLGDWQNYAVVIVLLFAAIYYLKKTRKSVVELFGKKNEMAVIRVFCHSRK